MFKEFVVFIVEKIENFSYTWIFIMMTIESSFIPFPSEVAMIPAWYLSSIWNMNFFIAFLAWTTWALLWSGINYFLWYKLWWPVIKKFIHKFWKYIFINENHYIIWEEYVKKHWKITIFNARFIPAIRQLISIPAWIFKMDIKWFLFYTWLGAWIWNLILLTIWYLVWTNKELIKKYTSMSLLIVIIIVIILTILYIKLNKKIKNDIR